MTSPRVRILQGPSYSSPSYFSLLLQKTATVCMSTSFPTLCNKRATWRMSGFLSISEPVVQSRKSCSHLLRFSARFPSSQGRVAPSPERWRICLVPLCSCLSLDSLPSTQCELSASCISARNLRPLLISYNSPFWSGNSRWNNMSQFLKSLSFLDQYILWCLSFSPCAPKSTGNWKLGQSS